MHTHLQPKKNSYTPTGRGVPRSEPARHLFSGRAPALMPRAVTYCGSPPPKFCGTCGTKAIAHPIGDERLSKGTASARVALFLFL